MVISIIRTIIMYIVVLFAVRFMGKRQVGQMQPYEFVITLIIAEMGIISMENNDVPMIDSFIPIVTLLLLQFSISYFSLKSQRFHQFVSGKPEILIRNGKIEEKVLKDTLISINDLMERLRIDGYFDIKGIQYAILETSGEISIIPKSDEKPITLKDLKINAAQEKIPITLVIDGKIQKENLKKAGYNETWLYQNLGIRSDKKLKTILFAELDGDGNFYCQRRMEEKI